MNRDKTDKIVARIGALAAIRHSLFAILLGLFCLLFAANSFAQSSNRWLFVFNTSSAMRDRAVGVQAVTQDLLTTAVHGTIRPGDTIGIWTYDAVLKAEEAPLQMWNPKAAPSIADNTLDFLRHHSYEKTAAFGDVMANLLRVIKISEVITVVLISDGTDPIKGTPFDDRIAAFYKTNYQPQKKARMPIVTVLRGEKGVITTNTLALAPWPVDVPAVPPPPIVTAAAKPAAVEPPTPKPVPSLVIIGKKAETTFNPPIDSPAHAGEPAPQPPTAPAPVEVTPAVAKVETPAVSMPETVSVVKVEPKPTTAPVVAAPAPAVASPTPAAEPSKPVQPMTAPVVVVSEPNAVPAAKATLPTAVEASSVVPQKELFSARNIAIISAVFTLLVCAMLFLSARNARRATRASLITRSLDRER
jgi:hypothetical protein